jgi:glycosyltransferase involved in cell wall biosynthesis
MAKDKLLFLTSRLPYPPIGGDRLKNYWLLKILSKHFKVHLVSITDQNVPKEFYDWANDLGLSYKIFQKNKKQFYLNTLKGLTTNRLPLQVNYYYFSDVQKYIDEIYHDYDLLFATLIRTAKYVSDKQKPKILEITDSIGLNYLRSASKTFSSKWKTIYLIERNRLLKFEKYCIEKFDKTLFVNKEERDYFNLPQKTEWLPNGVDEKLLTYENSDLKYKNYVAFFGKMDYQPNIDAVLWFVKNVLPYLNKNLKFIIVGAYPKRVVQGLPKKFKNIEVTGYVEDPYLILKSSLCVVAPMQTGGGIQNKILECMALGTINIVSSLAAKPIGAEHDKHFLVCDNPKDMANLINKIYEKPKDFEYLKQNARDFIKNNFTWQIYEKKLLDVIDNVLNENRRF